MWQKTTATIIMKRLSYIFIEFDSFKSCNTRRNFNKNRKQPPRISDLFSTPDKNSNLKFLYKHNNVTNPLYNTKKRKKKKLVIHLITFTIEHGTL